MSPEIEPIHFDLATDAVKFSLLGGSGLSRAIRQQLKSRQNVWGIGLWQDEDTEKVARQCAEIFGEELGLPAVFIPDDSIWLLIKYDDDGVQLACEVMMDEFGCEIDWQKLNGRKLLTFGDMVAIAKTGKGKVVQPPPAKWQLFKLWSGCAWSVFIALVIPLIGVALLIWHVIRYFMGE